MWRPSPKFFAATASLVLAAAFSCKTFDLPAETCDPAPLDARHGLQSENDCSRCLEDQCCDAVGVCDRKPAGTPPDKHPSCAKIVSDTHRCVLEAGVNGASDENHCATVAGLTALEEGGTDGGTTLVNPEADSAYRCMRGRCGAQCGLPVCKVDKAALLIRNADCDRCYAGGCCLDLNRCYENRACKLMLECIIGECGSDLGMAGTEGGAPSLPEGGAPGQPGGAGAVPDIERTCTEKPKDFPAGQCVLNCLCRFRKNDEGLPPTDPTAAPFVLAKKVFDCGQAANCGEACALPPADAGADAP